MQHGRERSALLIALLELEEEVAYNTVFGENFFDEIPRQNRFPTSWTCGHNEKVLVRGVGALLYSTLVVSFCFRSLDWDFSFLNFVDCFLLLGFLLSLLRILVTMNPFLNAPLLLGPVCRCLLLGLADRFLLLGPVDIFLLRSLLGHAEPLLKVPAVLEPLPGGTYTLRVLLHDCHVVHVVIVLDI